jgi:hypothetical protein
MRELLALLPIVCALGVFVACSESSTVWVEDIPFSEALTVVADTYKKVNGVPATDDVDAVVIYRLDETDGRHPNLSTLRWKMPAYESRDKGTIRRLLDAAAAEAHGPSVCLRTSGGDPQYYVAAYDHVLMRVGSFRVTVCEADSGRFATIQPTGGAGIYLSKDLAQVFGTLVPAVGVK